MHGLNMLKLIGQGSSGVILQEWRECVGQTPQNACNTCWPHLSRGGLYCGHVRASLFHCLDSVLC